MYYPGYPGSTGKPSEAGLEAAGRAAWSEALRTHTPDQIVLAGKSLGGFAVVSFVADLSQAGGPLPHGMIVESSFSSVMDVASEHYPWLPVRWFLQNKMISVDKAGQVTFPVLLLHGLEDELILPHHSKRLHAAFPNSDLVEYRVKGTMKTWANIRGVRQPFVLCWRLRTAVRPSLHPVR